MVWVRIQCLWGRLYYIDLHVAIDPPPPRHTPKKIEEAANGIFFFLFCQSESNDEGESRKRGLMGRKPGGFWVVTGPPISLSFSRPL